MVCSPKLQKKKKHVIVALSLGLCAMKIKTSGTGLGPIVSGVGGAKPEPLHEVRLPKVVIS